MSSYDYTYNPFICHNVHWQVEVLMSYDYIHLISLSLSLSLYIYIYTIISIGRWRCSCPSTTSGRTSSRPSTSAAPTRPVVRTSTHTSPHVPDTTPARPGHDAARPRTPPDTMSHAPRALLNAASASMRRIEQRKRPHSRGASTACIHGCMNAGAGAAECIMRRIHGRRGAGSDVEQAATWSRQRRGAGSGRRLPGGA
jgi:hypothetical protein